MARLSISQAVKATGRGRTTILRALRGRPAEGDRAEIPPKLSGERDETGTWWIDAAELFRVFPATGENEETDPSGNMTGNGVRSDPGRAPTTTSAAEVELAVLRERVSARDLTIADLREQANKADERAGAAEARAELAERTAREMTARVTALLEDRRDMDARRDVERPRPGWWGRLLGR